MLSDMTELPVTIRNPIFTDWQTKNSAMFGQVPQCLSHRLHQSPLFGLGSLAELIENYPRQHYSLIAMGPQGETERRYWREGDLGGLSGRQVIEAIAQGRMWLNLRSVKSVDPRFSALTRDVFEELSGYMPGFKAFDESTGILISSPKAQVYYHIDLPGQALWQIAGRKRVYIYPPAAPFLTPEQLEQVALFEIEVDVPYQDWYDEKALVIDLEPGHMLHWPLNAPHRIENHDCLNISMTMEYWSDDIRRAHIVNMANGILRHCFGHAPKSRSIHGPVYQAKALMQGVMRRTGWVRKARKAKRPISFILDADRPGATHDLPQAAE
jgi:hypothetical protein